MCNSFLSKSSYTYICLHWSSFFLTTPPLQIPNTRWKFLLSSTICNSIAQKRRMAILKNFSSYRFHWFTKLSNWLWLICCQKYCVLLYIHNFEIHAVTLPQGSQKIKNLIIIDYNLSLTLTKPASRFIIMIPNRKY